MSTITIEHVWRGRHHERQHTARLLGQTTGAALVALFLGRYPHEGTRIALLTAVGFALCGALLSMLRLSPAGARGAEHVRVQEGQRMKGD
jgi:MFS transporter, DHA2 family, multidrug resistance protein